MTNHTKPAFEVIAVDGSKAYFLDDNFEEFESHSGLGLNDLETAARTQTMVFVPADDSHYTVGRV
jgi:hypothetical protein